VCDNTDAAFSLIDFGCGYGALVSYLKRHGLPVRYTGYDLSKSMLEHAVREQADPPRFTFVTALDELEPADYTVASGIFNVKLDVSDSEWKEYVLRELETLARLSRRGFAFNMLTSYSDFDKMRPDLYYGDPRVFFDHCKRRYARNVALLHDYGLYEFTMIVRLGE
jgi:SAM-dependent methyltransferase